MKRSIFIVLWTAAFVVLALTASLMFGLSGVVVRRHYENGQSALTPAGMVLHTLLLGLPLLGLILGLLGRLPGTKRVERQARHDAQANSGDAGLASRSTVRHRWARCARTLLLEAHENKRMTMNKTTTAVLLVMVGTGIASAGPLDGTWINTDQNTRSIPKIRIFSSAKGGPQMEWWGRTHPHDSKYGPLKLHLLGDSTEDRSPDKHGYATQDSGFADNIFFITTSGDQLVLESLTLFKDNSGRSNYRKRLTFNRQP